MGCRIADQRAVVSDRGGVLTRSRVSPRRAASRLGETRPRASFDIEHLWDSDSSPAVVAAANRLLAARPPRRIGSRRLKLVVPPGTLPALDFSGDPVLPWRNRLRFLCGHLSFDMAATPQTADCNAADGLCCGWLLCFDGPASSEGCDCGARADADCKAFCEVNVLVLPPDGSDPNYRVEVEFTSGGIERIDLRRLSFRHRPHGVSQRIRSGRRRPAQLPSLEQRADPAVIHVRQLLRRGRRSDGLFDGPLIHRREPQRTQRIKTNPLSLCSSRVLCGLKKCPISSVTTAAARGASTNAIRCRFGIIVDRGR